MRRPRPLATFAAALLGIALTLAACGGGGGGGPITVSGQVLDNLGAPMSGAKVVLNGVTTSLVTTGADGKFTFSSVTPPYALAVRGGTRLIEIHGLTRAEPVVATGGAGAVRSVKLSGLFTGPTFPLPSGQAILLGATNGVLASTSSGASGGYGPTGFGWLGPSTITTDLSALQVTASSGLIASYGLFGKRSNVQLQDGVDETGLDIALTTPMTTKSTTLTYSAGAYTTTGAMSYLTLKGGGATFLLLGGTLPIASGASVLLPDGGGTFLARGQDASGNSAGLIRSAVLGGTTSFALPASVLLKSSLPAAGATGVSKTPILSWTPVSGATLYDVQLSGGGQSYVFFLPGDTSTFSFPDLSALGIPLTGGTSYDWSVTAVMGGGFRPDTIADPAGGGGLNEYALVLAQDLTFYVSASNSFTTAP